MRDKKGRFIKGHSFNEGRSHSEETRNKISKKLLGHPPNSGSFKKGDPRLVGENNHKWKGDNVGYVGIHHWIKKKLGYPKICEFCKKSGFSKAGIHWANKSGQYKRDTKDWIRLCAKCHHIYDDLYAKRKVAFNRTIQKRRENQT